MIINRGTNAIGRTMIAEPPPTTAACCCPACQGLQCLDRTRFFAGQLLTDADLNNDQSYWLAKSRLHNRFLHGWGVVCGMQVVCGECDGWVTVKTGYAVDPCGNDIIICNDQPFNVIKAIQECCKPVKPAPDCSPLRYTPAPQCRDAIQTWCITIQYQEQPSRLVTPLVQSSAQTACCSTHGGSHNGYAAKSNGCCCASGTQAVATAVATPACEPTRIIEGFQLCVVAPPPAAQAEDQTPGNWSYEVEQCGAGLFQLSEQAPDLSSVTDAKVAYQSTCNYLIAVRQYLARHAMTTQCHILDDLAAIQIPAPDSTTAVSVYVGYVAQIKQLVSQALLDCICFALLPSCPPDPCDNRVILACVTVQDGKITNICHFTGRKQIITWPALHYWLGPLGLDQLAGAVVQSLQQFCCGDEGSNTQGIQFGLLGSSKAFQREVFTSAPPTNTAVFNRMAGHFLAQTLGASAVNAIAPMAQAVDLRPLVGQSIDAVNANLKSLGFTQVTQEAVDADPAWTADAVASSQQFAPSAVSVGQPLTMFTKGNVAVGFDVVDPTTAKLQDLQNRVLDLQNQIQQMQAPKQTPKK